jgi:hypothetical protein
MVITKVYNTECWYYRGMAEITTVKRFIILALECYTYNLVITPMSLVHFLSYGAKGLFTFAILEVKNRTRRYLKIGPH